MTCVLHYIYMLHCCVFILSMKQCCASGSYRDFLYEKDKNDIAISSEEVIRRRKLVDSYLSKRATVEKDWIETYHLNLPESSLSHEIVKQKSPELKHELNVPTVPESTNKPVISKIRKLNGKLTHEEFTCRRDIFFSSYPKLSKPEEEDSEESGRVFYEKEVRRLKKPVSNDKVISLKAKPQVTLQQSFEFERNDIEKIKLVIKNSELNTGEEKTPNFFQTSEKDSDSVSDLKISKNVETGQLYSESIKRKLSPNIIIGPKNKDSHLIVNSNDGVVQKIEHSSQKPFKEKAHVNNDAAIHSVRNVKITESGIYKGIKNNNLDINSRGREIKDKQVGAEMPDVKFNEFLRKQEVPLINSVTQVNSELKNEVVKHKNEELFNACNNEREIKTDSLNYKANELKISPSEFEKREGDLSKAEATFNSENSVTVQQIKASSLSESTNIKGVGILDNNLEAEEDTFSFDLDILHRQQLVSLYLSTFNEKQKNWIETYYFDYMKHDDHDKNIRCSQENIAQAEINSKQGRSSQERLYFARWINKLQQKFAGCALHENNVLLLSFSTSSLNKLRTVSSPESFDIVMFDELLSDLIMNATLNNEYSLNNRIHYILSSVSIVYILATIFLCLSVRYCKDLRGYFKYLIIFILVIVWHGFHMYQAKVAEKHATMSRVPSQYCESILSHESGFYAHVKEYFRSSYHDEDCRKYYTALMIDPLTEISPTIVVSDLVSSCISHLILPFGSVINVFYTKLTFGLWFYQIPMVVLVLFVICYIGLLIYSVVMKHEVTLPFGCTIKPTRLPVGSNVEDVVLNKQDFFLQNSCKKSSIPSINYNSQSKSIFFNNTSFILRKKDNSPVEEKCLDFQSSHCLNKKMPRHRHASF